jgi:hypothetical protein
MSKSEGAIAGSTIWLTLGATKPVASLEDTSLDFARV